jgi:predicted anti-sigma-YlaC factor YlaD
VGCAESISVKNQNKAEFTEMLEKALAIDAIQPSDQRLSNLLAQKRARWLLGRVDELFVE